MSSSIRAAVYVVRWSVPKSSSSRDEEEEKGWLLPGLRRHSCFLPDPNLPSKKRFKDTETPSRENESAL
jgi:hypothetical protein